MSGWKDYEKIIESVDNKTGTAEKNQEKNTKKTLQGKVYLGLKHSVKQFE